MVEHSVVYQLLVTVYCNSLKRTLVAPQEVRLNAAKALAVSELERLVYFIERLGEDSTECVLLLEKMFWLFS